MQRFSASQLAVIAGGLMAQDALDERYRRAGSRIGYTDLELSSVASWLNRVYRRLDRPLVWADLDESAILTAIDRIYRKLGIPITWDDIDPVTVTAALDILYRRLDALIGWSDLDAASIHAALDPRYAPAHHIRNYGTTVTGTELVLPTVPTSHADPQVFINGLLNDPGFYTISGSTITFASALAADAVQVIYSEATA